MTALEQATVGAPPGSIPTRDHHAVLSFGVLAAALGLFVILAVHMAPYLPDDVFISYRYAENLGTGHGLTFNAGEAPVEGYSNFLWIVIAALLRRFGLDIVVWMPRIGIVAGMFVVLLLWLMYRRRNVPPSAMILPLALLCSSGPLMLYAVSGFEAPLFSLLLVMLLFTLENVLRTNSVAQWIALASVGVLLLLTRPEGIVAFPAAMGMILLLTWKASGAAKPLSRVRPALLASALFLTSLGLYTYWRVQYFHELLPTPLLSKGGAGGGLTAAWWINAEMYFDRQGVDESASAPLGYYYLALVLAAIAGTIASRSRHAEKCTEVVALILGVLYCLIYINFVDWYPAMRYHSALTPLFFLPGVWLGNAGVEQRPSKDNAARFAGLVAVGMALLSTNVSIFNEVRMEARRSIPFGDRLLSLAEWLRKSAPADVLVAAADVGMLPYYSGLKTFDIHPAALVDLHIAKSGFSTSYFFARDPDVVLLTTRRGWVFRKSEQQIISDARFPERYRLLGTIRLAWFEDLSYRVYVKNRIAISAERVAEFPKGIAGPT